MNPILTNVSFAQRQPHPLLPNRALETMYCNPSSKKACASAVNWATGRWPSSPNGLGDLYYESAASYQACRQHMPAFTPSVLVTRPNVPMTGLVIIGLEERGNGGRAFKVTYPGDNSLFDVREDQVLQAMINHGIQKGGILGGEWVWAMNHTQIKCYLVDGVEYQNMLRANGV